jgi:catechol 2,3-dioxygenase-like lactoylglutathione lyase family enzyme
MRQTLGHVALVVRDYDEALAFFTGTLNFKLIEDTRLSEDERWVLIAPPGSIRYKLAFGQSSNSRAGESYRQSDRRASLSFSAHRRFLARLQRDDRAQSKVHAPAERRTLRHSRGLRRPVRQSMGPIASKGRERPRRTPTLSRQGFKYLPNRTTTEFCAAASK